MLIDPLKYALSWKRVLPNGQEVLGEDLTIEKSYYLECGPDETVYWALWVQDPDPMYEENGSSDDRGTFYTVGRPSKPINPSPSNGAPINTNVSWSNGGGATSYLVYFGTDSTPDSGEYKGEQSGTSYDPGTLAYSTTYYWRIDAKNSAGTTTGDVWSFRTEKE